MNRKRIFFLTRKLLQGLLLIGVLAPAMASDLNQITLALKYVTYTHIDGTPVVSALTAKRVVESVNQYYSQCKIRFKIEEFLVAHPKDYSLAEHPTSMQELDVIRKKFDEPNRLIVINTGNWNHVGGLGADGANAWTMLPGESPSGAVIEGSVADFAGLIAHELGHYLNLSHLKDQTNLMNPVIFAYSKSLSPNQCEQIRESATSARSGSLRSG